MTIAITGLDVTIFPPTPAPLRRMTRDKLNSIIRAKQNQYEEYVEVNLNSGSGGDYIYPIIEKGNIEKALCTELIITLQYKGSRPNPPDGYSEVFKNRNSLNQGNSSNYWVRLFYKKENDKPPITDIIFKNTGNNGNPPKKLFDGMYSIVNVWNENDTPANLNRGTKNGAAYVYMYTTNEPFSALDVSQGVPQELLNNPKKKHYVSSTQINEFHVLRQFYELDQQIHDLPEGNKKTFKIKRGASKTRSESFTKAVEKVGGITLKGVSVSIKKTEESSTTTEYKFETETETQTEYTVKPSQSGKRLVRVTQSQVKDTLELWYLGKEYEPKCLSSVSQYLGCSSIDQS